MTPAQFRYLKALQQKRPERPYGRLRVICIKNGWIDDCVKVNATGRMLPWRAAAKTAYSPDEYTFHGDYLMQAGIEAIRIYETTTVTPAKEITEIEG